MELKINRDITKYKPVTIGSLTQRQALIGLCTIFVAGVVFFLTRKWPTEISGILMLIGCMPVAVFILDEIPYFRMPMEQVIPVLLLYIKTPKHSVVDSYYYDQPEERDKYSYMNKGKYKLPSSIQDMIPLDEFFEDGICRKGNKYSAIYRFSDIDFIVLSDAEKSEIMLKFEECITSFQPDAEYKITIKNQSYDSLLFYWEMEFPGFYPNEKLSDEMNVLLKDEIKNKNQQYHDLLITVTVACKNYQEAKIYFDNCDTDMFNKLSELQSSVHRLTIYERMKLYFDIYHPDYEKPFTFKGLDTLKGTDIKDFICPSKWVKHDSYMEIGNKFARTLYLQTTTTQINERFYTSLTENINNLSISSICIRPISQAETNRILNTAITSSRRKISNYKQSKAKKLEITDEAPPSYEQEFKDCKQIYDDCNERDQKLFSCTILVTIFANNLEELNNSTSSLRSQAAKRLCSFDILYYQQVQGLFSCLPFGVSNSIRCQKTLTTESIAAFIPFTSQIIQNLGIKATWIGSNPISHKINSIDRSNLFNGNGVLFGVPGSGKSVQNKLEIIQRRIKEYSYGRIIILDPQGEYSRLVQELGGITVKVSVGSADHINIMELHRNYGAEAEKESRTDPVRKKISFITSFINEIYTDTNQGSHVSSIISRCCMKLYKELIKNDYAPEFQPTLVQLYEELKKQKEDVAQDICLAIEQYVYGAMDIFAKQSNIGEDNGIINYDLSDMDEGIESLGMMVMIDRIFNSIAINRSNDLYTYIYIDEFHKFFGTAAEPLIMNLWRMGRKLHCYSTGITQHISDVIESVNGRKIVEDSEYLQILKCGNLTITDDLTRLVKIPPALIKYIQGEKNPEERSRSSSGLIKYSGTVIPFVSEIPTNSYIYDLINTD